MSGALPHPTIPAYAVDTLIDALSRRIGLAPGAAPAARARAYAAALSADRFAAVLRDLEAGRRTTDVDAIVDQATNRETYLFRDRRQLSLLQRELSMRLRAAPDPRPVTLWSAGCASGEEVFSLAIIAIRAMIAVGAASLAMDGEVRFAPGWSLRVLGTDVCAEAIRRATNPLFRAGPMAALRDPVPSDLFLFRVIDGGYVPLDSLARCVRFDVANILDGVPSGGPFDAVVCRNVLFYFAPAPRARAVSILMAATAKGGRLVLGSTDPAPDDPSFDARHDDGAIVHARSL
jgi:chemotaxis protein methyltransferase CheR